MFNLGVTYEQGRGVEKDTAEAVRWYRKAAEAGDVEGMAHLGVMYAQGIGVAKDEAEARKWLSKAASLSDKNATEQIQQLQTKPEPQK